MERKNSSASEYFKCKKMREALSTIPAFRAITNRFSLHRQQSKTVAIDSNSPPSSSPVTVRTIHIQNKPTTTKTQDSAEAVPIRFDYSVPATKDHVRVSERAEKKDMNNVFEDYIERTKYRIRTVSNAGRGQGGDAFLADDKDANSKDHGKKKDNHREQISNFIHVARRKIRTTSGIRRE